MPAPLAAITGATGFLGRYIVGALKAAGWQVRLLSRREAVHPQFAGLSFDTVPGDLSDRRALQALVDGADAVVHAAGLIKAPTLAAFRAVNVDGTQTLVGALNDCAPDKTVVFVSSMAAREPHLSPYARTKREAEDLALSLRQDWTIVRPCAVYGPWDRETLAIFRAAAGRIFPVPNRRGGQMAWIHAADAADAIAALCRGGGAPGRVFELTDRRVAGYSWPEIVEVLESAVGPSILAVPVPGFVARSAAAANMAFARLLGRTPIFTPGKAREFLHGDWGSTADRQPPPDIWQPRIGLEDGFRETVSWYRERNWLPLPAVRPLPAGVIR